MSEEIKDIEDDEGHDHMGDVRKALQESEDDHHAPGTMVLALTLLVSFVIYYFANWKALADVWHVR